MYFSQCSEATTLERIGENIIANVNGKVSKGESGEMIDYLLGKSANTSVTL